jgi:hypothetical protein
MIYTAEQLRHFPWIVCDRASLRDCDLADAFQSAIAEIAQIRKLPTRADGMPESLPERDCRTLARLAVLSCRPMGPRFLESHRWTVDAAFDWLAEHSPYGFCFGANEGDGSCFGFWATEETIETLEDVGIQSEDPTTIAIEVWLADYPAGPNSVYWADKLVAEPFVWPGGYPLHAVTSDGGTLCRKCCATERESIATPVQHDGWQVMGLQVNWENPDLLCDHCGERIESAYAESEAIK